MSWKRVTQTKNDPEYKGNIKRDLPPCESCGSNDYIIKLTPKGYDPKENRYFRNEGQGRVYDPPGTNIIRGVGICRTNADNPEKCQPRYSDGRWPSPIISIVVDPLTKTWISERQYIKLQNVRGDYKYIKKFWEDLDGAEE